MTGRKVKPALPCMMCLKPNKVYNPDELCSRCQARKWRVIGKMKDDMFEPARPGYRSLGGAGRWVKRSHT